MMTHYKCNMQHGPCTCQVVSQGVHPRASGGRAVWQSPHLFKDHPLCIHIMFHFILAACWLLSHLGPIVLTQSCSVCPDVTGQAS